MVAVLLGFMGEHQMTRTFYTRRKPFYHCKGSPKKIMKKSASGGGTVRNIFIKVFYDFLIKKKYFIFYLLAAKNSFVV